MNHTRMTPPRFKELVVAYGSALERWPEAERPLARELLAGSTEARGWLEEAQRLDQVLSTAAVAPTPSARLQALVSAIPARCPRADVVTHHWLFGRPWRPLLALAASAFSGVISGWWTAPAADSAEAPSFEASTLSADPAEELDGLLAVAFNWDLDEDESDPGAIDAAAGSALPEPVGGGAVSVDEPEPVPAAGVFSLQAPRVEAKAKAKNKFRIFTRRN